MTTDPTADTSAALTDLFRDPLPPEWCEAHTLAAIAAACVPDDPETEAMRDAGMMSDPPPRFGEWHPIETAPKDGTRNLVGCRVWPSDWTAAVVRWDGAWWIDHADYAVAAECWTALPPPPVQP